VGLGQPWAISGLQSDDVESPEEDVFAAVLAWVKEDEAARKAELDRLLPLVRFPMMADSALVRRGTKIAQGWPKLQDLVQHFG
jgi:hypothetical protein